MTRGYVTVFTGELAPTEVRRGYVTAFAGVLITGVDDAPTIPNMPMPEMPRPWAASTAEVLNRAWLWRRKDHPP